MLGKRRHTIALQAGDVVLEESDGHVTINTERLNVPNISVHLNTVWSDTDLAVCVNGKWMTEAYAAGQHKHREATSGKA